MPSYTWKCNKCKELTIETKKSINEYDIPPKDGCGNCNSTDLRRILSPSLVNGKLEKGFYNSKGSMNCYDSNDFNT